MEVPGAGFAMEPRTNLAALPVSLLTLWLQTYPDRKYFHYPNGRAIGVIKACCVDLARREQDLNLRDMPCSAGCWTRKTARNPRSGMRAASVVRSVPRSGDGRGASIASPAGERLIRFG